MLKQALLEFWQDESGLTAVEYAIAGGLVVGGMVVAFSDLGTEASDQIGCIEDAVSGIATDCS